MSSKQGAGTTLRQQGWGRQTRHRVYRVHTHTHTHTHTLTHTHKHTSTRAHEHTSTCKLAHIRMYSTHVPNISRGLQVYSDCQATVGRSRIHRCTSADPQDTSLHLHQQTVHLRAQTAHSLQMARFTLSEFIRSRIGLTSRDA